MPCKEKNRKKEKKREKEKKRKKRKKKEKKKKKSSIDVFFLENICIAPFST